MKIRTWLPLLPLLLLSYNLADASERIVGIGIAKNDHVYVWFADGKVTSGTTSNFEKHRHAYSYSLPPGKTPDDIVAISIAGSNDHVYAWYKDGYVSSGTSDDLDKYRAPYKFTLPLKKTAKNIIGIGIAGSNDHVYAWYDDGQWSSGTTDDLDDYAGLSSSSLPSSKTAADVVEIDIAKSNDDVYVWYRDGFVSKGTSNNLSHNRSYGYVDSQVLYRWWGPAAPAKKATPVNFSEMFASQKDRGPGDLYKRPTAESHSTISNRSELELKNEPADSAILLRSPTWSEPRFTSDTGGSVDPMIAVGNQYLITSDTGSIAFYDKQGNVLPVTNGMPTKMSANKFFEGFLAETNADGSFNESNINHHLGFPKPCDSSEYPQTSTGKRFCIDSFYDTRVFFDATSKRFFVISNSRHPLWAAAKYEEEYGTCGVYTNSSGDNVGTDDYCELTRRYIAFAVSRTEDPRDGFHQYMNTESNNRDFPWMAVNGNAFIIANKGAESTVGPVATVFSVNAVKSGDQHPAYFRYYVQDLGGVSLAIPPVHHKNATGLSFLLAGSGDRIDIFAFRQATDPWIGPALLKTSVTLSDGISFYNAVYRSGKLYLVGNKEEEKVGEARRYSVRLVRVPIEEPSASSIKASTATSKGFLDVAFGKNNQADPPGSRISYEKPALAVNKNGDMLFAYGRYPFSPADGLNPEARYTYWFGNETKQRPSHILQEGTALNSETIVSALDYATAVVDPSNDLTFWMAVPYSAGGVYRTVIGKVRP